MADRGRSSSTVRVIVGVAMAGAVALAGCGGDDEEKPKGADLTAIRCPFVPTGDEAGGATGYKPAPDAFDTAELIGMPLEDAQAHAAKRGCTIVVAMEDGRGVAVPTDIDPKRIYVYTEDGEVTRIEGVGGGL
jgi:hypothetical protein